MNIAILSILIFFTDAQRIGKNSSLLMSKIIGGDVVSDIDTLPFMASLRKNNKYLCTGVMISSEHFLTAAQSVYLHKDDGPHYKGLIIVGGTTKIEEGGHLSPVAHIHVNGFYRLTPGAFGYDDIAVVTLTNSFGLYESFKRIDFPSSDAFEPDVSYILASWGSESSFKANQDPIYSPVLKKAYFKMYDHEMCKRFFEKRGIYVLDSHICAIPVYRQQNLASGDGGSPLIDDTIVVGIHVFSLREEIYSPSIFTPVYSYINFIHMAMREGIRRKVQYRLNLRKTRKNHKRVG